MSRYKKRKKTPKPDPRQRIGDYRIFIGAFPTGDLASKIQAVREQYDAKTARISAPHVTIAGTYWRDGVPTAKNEAELIDKLQTLSSSLAPFEMQLGGIYTFGQRVAYLGVAQSEALVHTRDALLAVSGRDKHRQFKPHLTLAMRLKQPAFSEMVTELRESEWHNTQFVTSITELHFMQRGPKDSAWRSISTIPLLG